MKKFLLTLAILLSVNLVKAQLGPNQGDAYEISNNSGNTIANSVMHKIWLYRNSTGNNWFSASVHDGIAVDLSFLEPGVSTRAWWERNPYSGEQRWGNSGQTWLTLSDAKVGVGTTAPTAPLQIMSLGGESRPGGINAASSSALKLSRPGTPNYSYPESAEFRVGHGGSSIWGSQLDLYLNGVANQTDVPDQQVMTWQYNGNVGIGIIDPNAKLDVQGTAKFGGENGNLDIAGNPPAYQHLSGSGKVLIGHNRTAGDGETDFVANEGNGNGGGFAFYSFNNSSQEKQLLRISGNGNIGIGTNRPAERLSVNGNIRSKEVRVEAANWPDYVFEEGYQIGKLEELESYIKIHQHLPDMPSAKEVEANGIALGEMVKLQQQKIEELTLHLIDQHKTIEALNKENNSFKFERKQNENQLAEILNRINRLEKQK